MVRPRKVRTCDRADTERPDIEIVRLETRRLRVPEQPPRRTRPRCRRRTPAAEMASSCSNVARPEMDLVRPRVSAHHEEALVEGTAEADLEQGDELLQDVAPVAAVADSSPSELVCQ